MNDADSDRITFRITMQADHRDELTLVYADVTPMDEATHIECTVHPGVRLMPMDVQLRVDAIINAMEEAVGKVAAGRHEEARVEDLIDYALHGGDRMDGLLDEPHEGNEQ